MRFFKGLLKGCGIFLGIVSILFGVIGVIALFSGGLNTLLSISRSFPELTSPKSITLKCDYAGEAVTIDQTLYGSVYEHYKSDPKKKNIYRSGKNEEFVFSYEEDNTIKEITKKIKDKGTVKGLSGDQTLDLAACMIQNIPYDQAKADKILSGKSYSMEEIIPRYPYEVLYDYTGVCTGKTFLGGVIAKELGYDAGILTFEKEQHMMLGVGVPGGYGSFNTKYGGLELTNVGFKVGTIAERSSTGSAVGRINEISGDTKSFQNGSLTLGEPSVVVAVSEGSLYERIKERQSINTKMDQLWAELTKMQPEVEEANAAAAVAEGKVDQAYKTYLASNTDAAYQNYTSEYSKYKVVYKKGASLVASYNSKVSEYNSLVTKYQNF